ncbi:MAG: type II toxin-antitoxin system VapC family toxin [Candidatus Ratteibacteria bacterium]|nr:type II toxin-antitoxin system VapC family toxin [Candidatus Ratteibacteria bacterium]
MAKSNRNPENIEAIILDTDVVVNWLTQEVETSTKRKLWETPYNIITLIESEKFKGLTCLTTLLEIRYLLRRKKGYSEHQIENSINEITSILEVVIPDEIGLLEANKLQAQNKLDPFDAILLGLAITLKPTVFISRDSEFLKIASRFITAFTPEHFFQHYT